MANFTSPAELESTNSRIPPEVDLVCFSHLRWNFVFQRPQHLLSRIAKQRRVYFVEEPIFTHDLEGGAATMELHEAMPNVFVAVPKLPHGVSCEDVIATQKTLVDQLLDEQVSSDYVAWYYTPMARKFTRHLSPMTTVYDCMDQLSHFKDAPTEMSVLEAELFEVADVVFTGGQSLYEDKRTKHGNVHAFPSSVDGPHFRKARARIAEPGDQAAIPHPRIGYVGVIDERLDIDLLYAVATARPDWQLVMIGPVVKIDPESLPRRDNIHYLGGKTYDELPAYLSSWDVAMLPFARNAATTFISPTKTPEYLAAGCRVVSTSIRDVVRPYGAQGFVKIADTPTETIEAIDSMLGDEAGRASWLLGVDAFLSRLSWDKTAERMWAQVELVALADDFEASESSVSLPVGATSRSRAGAAAAAPS